MARTPWSYRPEAAELREVYAAVVDLARRATFRQPRSGWPAELVLAHLAMIADHLVTVGDAVRRGERPVAGNPDHVDDETLARRVADAGGLPGLLDQLEAGGERLAAHAESLTEAEAATPVRLTVYHYGRQIVDEPQPWGMILASQARFHLPLHARQLLAMAATAPR
ncbi:MAG TPA: hypothetical protein VOB72_22700 [Candidatus Dormibacteraeota bacterium]|nr:hypothetical protein [Candidatus Dormibacteraeota bacterium]